MEAQAGGSALGPALFVGLSLFALVTQGEPEIDPNPLSRLEESSLVAAAAPQALLAALATGWASPADARPLSLSAAALQTHASQIPAVQAQLTSVRPSATVQLPIALSPPQNVAMAGPLPAANGATQLRQPDMMATAPGHDPAPLGPALSKRPGAESTDRAEAIAAAPPMFDWRGSEPDGPFGTPAQPSLIVEASPDTWSPPPAPLWVRLLRDRVYLRTEPSLQATTIDLFPVGSYAQVRGAEEKWVLVSIGGQTGWMWASYLTPVAPE